MSKIRIKYIQIENYRSFGDSQYFEFPDGSHKKPVAITGYNNSGKTNLLNAILYGIGEKYVSRDTFTIDDFHYKNIDNVPEIILNIESSTEKKFDGKDAKMTGFHKLNILIDGDEIEGSKIEAFNSLGGKYNYQGDLVDDLNYQAFGASRYFKIFYINFHNIKEEISTQKTSWGNLKSFLAKHIKNIVETDDIMKQRKNDYKAEIEKATKKVLEGNETDTEKSQLHIFIEKIQEKYSENLRNNNCEVDFGLPDYEDIFLQMIFKIGLNGRNENLVPISHFGDGFISMFVMAVIQAIADSDTEDKCLFLFEEPESFLHENHQEYFYKMVLCSLAEKGHQVIYTTHSDKLVDIFDTQGLIRLELEEKEDSISQTINKFNNPKPLSENDKFSSYENELAIYNSYIKYIEPNLNKILFSKKVVLVEGPNDILTYKFAIEKKVKQKIINRTDILDKEKYAQTYLSFFNIAIIPHHGKSTALLLMRLCNYIGLDYFVITDWDFKTDFKDKVSLDIDALMTDDIWNEIKEEKNRKGNIMAESTIKAMITNNRNLAKEAKENQIHFNFPRLEEAIGYEANDKDSLKIWNKLQGLDINEKLFPDNLVKYLEIDKLEKDLIQDNQETDLPF